MRGNALQMLQVRAEKWQIAHDKKVELLKSERLEASKVARKLYLKKRMKDDINFRLASLLRKRINNAVKREGKGGSAVRDLGCSIPDLKTYLESKFVEGMMWETYGKWQIDHIVPLASFDLADREQFLRACHYTNLQPLWAIDNRKKMASIVIPN